VALGVVWSGGFATFDWRSVARIGIAATLCCVALLPLWPQIRFKPQVRTLELDESGYKTSIGHLNGKRRWSAIRSVDDDGNTIVLTMRQGNAMLIPYRAFGDGIDRQQFVSDVRAWHSRATN
jgi:YcxB-like protein